MNLERAIHQLKQNASRIQALVAPIDSDQAKWKPDEATWSILETVTHLYDEEKEDFRVRLGNILDQAEAEWPPIDPAGWVKTRQYNECELDGSLNGYLEERQHSIQWLQSLDNPDFTLGKDAPWGVMQAGDMLAAWVAHDLLHMRQLVELLYAYEVEGVRPYRVLYAGEW